MLSRRQPIRTRLRRAFAIFAGSLLLITWVVSLAYFLVSERDEQRRNLLTQLSVIATQSSAAVMFGDRVALAESLSTMVYMPNLRWMVVEGPPSPADPGGAAQRLAEYGKPPANLKTLLAGRPSDGEVLTSLTEIIVRRAVVHNETKRGELLAALDLSDVLVEFGTLALASLALNLLFFLGATAVFDRIVRTVADPVEALVEVSAKVAREGSGAARARVEFDDEIGTLGRAINHMLDSIAVRERDLSRSREELRALSRRLQEVREAERTRISHEIHDELGQRLTALKFQLAREVDAEAAKRLGLVVDAIINKVRTISWDLRPSLLDGLGLAPAIEWLSQDFQQRMGIRCRCEAPAALADVGDQATDVFRICQELLTNVARHANASRVLVKLEQSSESTVLEVDDDGVGLPAVAPARPSLGLLGIRERCARWGGTLHTAPGQSGHGTWVRVTLPRAANKASLHDSEKT